MKLKDLKKVKKIEKKTIRGNLRLYPSQVKFIKKHKISIQKIFDKALEELGYK